jgi:hypothetical protein
MSPSAPPRAPRRHARLWSIAVYSLIGIVSLTTLAGAVHWYNLYARSLGPVVTAPRLLDKGGAVEKPKAEKAGSGEKTGGSATPSAAEQDDAAAKVGHHKSSAKPTQTPGA